MKPMFEDRVAKRKQALAGDSFSPMNPARTFEDNLLVNVDGSFGVGIKCQFPNTFTLSVERRAEVFTRLRTAMNILGEDYDVQFIFDDNGRHEEFLANLNPPEVQGLLADYGAEQIEQLSEGFQAGHLRWMVAYICIVRKNPFPPGHFRQRNAEQTEPNGKSAKKISAFIKRFTTAFAGGELAIVYSEAEWEVFKGEFFTHADAFFAELASAGLSPSVLDPNGALELLYQYYNPSGYDAGGRPRKYNPIEDLPLTDYFLSSGPDWDRDSGIFKLDGQPALLATVESPPEQVEFSQFEKILLPAGSRGVRYIATFRHSSLEKRIKLVSERVPELETLAKKNPFFRSQYLDAARELEELGKGLEKAWTAQQVFIIRGKTEDEVRRRYNSLRGFAERSSGMKITHENHAVIDYLIASQPFWTRDTDVNRYLPYSTSQAATQIPAFGQPGMFDDASGRTAKIGAIYETTTGGMLNLLLHDDTRFSNSNALVIGGSGKGKGVFVNDFIAQTKLRHPCRFIVIDADVRAKGGGSYRRTAECLGGSYVDFDLTTKGRVSNPFFTEGNHYPDQEELDAMTSALERYLVTETQRRLDPMEINVVEMTIKQLFRNAQGKREVTLSDFRKLLNEYEQGRTLASRLGRWTGDGAYANLADGQNGHDISKWLTVFNLTRIADNKTVCPIVFANIFATVGQLASRYPKEMKFVIFDECASFLRDPVVAAYIEKCYRQMRKAGVAVIGVSQSLEEFLSTESRTGFINNTDHLFLLQQGATEAADMIRDTFRLSNAEYNALLELKSSPGEFSQIMLRHKMGDGSFQADIAVKRPTPLGYAMATSNPRDHDAFTDIREKGISFTDAVRKFAQLYPNGAARSAPANLS